MRKFSLLLLMALIVQLIPARVFAWGKKGHELVAEVAFHYLDDSTKMKVMQYLGKTSIEDAANWMDEMRSNDYYDFMKPWHYVNVEKGDSYKPDLKNRDILIILNSAIAELKNYKKMKDKDVRERLYYIFHLIGDLHQPLHVGYGIDKGGNTINVSFMFKTRSTNLHRAWDTDIIEQKNIQVADVLKQEINFTPDQLVSLKKVNVLEWMNESRSHLATVYDFKDEFLDPSYVDKNTDLVERQLYLAGIRLAEILKEGFGN